MNPPPPHHDPLLQADPEAERLLKAARETRPEVPPLDAFTRARILQAARRVRLRRRMAPPLAAAAALAFFLAAALVFRPQGMPPALVTNPVEARTLSDFDADDPLMFDLDLMDLELQEMMSLDWFVASNGPPDFLTEPPQNEESI